MGAHAQQASPSLLPHFFCGQPGRSRRDRPAKSGDGHPHDGHPHDVSPYAGNSYVGGSHTGPCHAPHTWTDLVYIVPTGACAECAESLLAVRRLDWDLEIDTILFANDADSHDKYKVGDFTARWRSLSVVPSTWWRR